MPYSEVDSINIPAETKDEVREVKDEIGISYREFLERAVEQVPENDSESN